MNKRFSELTVSAADFANDDVIALDSETNGTRKMSGSALKSAMKANTLATADSNAYVVSDGDVVRIKDWATSITAFRTGDVIPVDGPDGTAKMSKDDLLKEAAENALGKVNNTENLSFIAKSAQRFNYLNVTRGYYYYNSGTFVDDASYVKSEFIRIGEETTMWFNKIAHITFWDEGGNYVSGVVNGSEAWSSAISIPVGAYYVCVATLKNTSRNAVLNFGDSHLVLADLSEYRYWEDLKFGIDRTCNTFKLPFVRDGKLCCNIVSAARTAYYTSVNLGSNVYKFNVSWIWEAGTSTGTIAVVLNPNGMNRIKNITDSSLHLTLTASRLKVDCLGNKWGEYYYANLIDHTFDTPMDLDGTTEHTLSLTVNLDGENIAVNVDGDSYSGVFTDTHGNNLHLSDFYGQYATIEHYCDGNRNDTAMPMFTSFKVLAISTPSAFDYFERENGVLQCTPTGHPYSLMVNDSRFA